jgi:hypothetical protein
MKTATTLLVLVIICGNLTISAAVKTNTPAKAEVAKKSKATKPPEKVQDYSRGFAQFKSFGLPEVKTAKYIKLNTFFNTIDSNNLPYEARTKGNAWLLKEDKKSGKALVIINQGTVIDIYDQQKLIKKLQKKNKTVMQNWHKDLNNYLSGTWKETDIKADAKKLINYLKKAVKKKDRYWDPHGGLFLFAAQLHNKGLKDDANKIAALLFKLGKSKRQVLLGALNALADAQYNAVYLQFSQDHDLQKFSDNITPLLKRYTVGWQKAPGIIKLQTLLQEQLSGKKVTAAYKKLTVAEKKLADAMLTEKLEPFGNKLWLLPPQVKSKISKLASPKTATAKNSKAVKSMAETKSTVIADITARGMAAVPMLIKLLDDNRFVMTSKNRFTRTSTRYNDYGMFGRGSDNGDDISRANRIFNRMPRPMTRGEVAKFLLQSIIIMEVDENDRNADKSPEALKELCRAWYKTNKSKSPIELATAYLQNGNDSQKTAAADYLLASNAATQYLLIEKELLSGKRERYGNRTRDALAVKYVSKLGKDATGFIEKYIKILDPDGSIQQDAADKKNKKNSKKKDKDKKTKIKNPTKSRGDGMFVEASGSDDQGDGMFENEQGNQISEWEKRAILSQINKLRTLASNKSAEDILNDVVEKRQAWNQELIEIVISRMRDNNLSPDEQLAIWLTAADKFAKADNRWMITPMLTRALQGIKPNNMQSHRIYPMRGSKQPAITPPILIAAKNRKIWEKLLKNKMKVGRDNLRDLAAIYNELIYGTDKRVDISMTKFILGDLYQKRLHKRVTARLAGTPEDKLPQLPNINKLDRTKKQQQIAAVMKKMNATKDIKHLQQVLTSLSLKELLRLKQGLDDAPKINARLVVLANKITKVETKVKSAEKFKKFSGMQLSKSLIDDLQSYALDGLKTNNPVSCKIYRKSCFAGCTIEIEEIPLKNLTKVKTDINKKFVLTGYIAFPGTSRSQAYWTTEQKTASTVTTKNNSDDDEDDLFNEVEDDINTDAQNIYAENQQLFADKLLQIEQGKINTLLGCKIVFYLVLKQYTL